MTRIVAVEFDHKLVKRIVWEERLPITRFWCRCWDTFLNTRESQLRAARRLQQLNQAVGIS